MAHTNGTLSLDKLRKNQRAVITAFDKHSPLKTSENQDVEKKLLEFGFCEGSSVQLLHYSPFGKDPLVVLLHNSQIVALRKAEARKILVEVRTP